MPELSHSPARVEGTAIGVILGTASYMSPEQARGKTLDKRTDNWAYGCCLYEILTAQKAFSGSDITEILAAVLRAEVDSERLPGDLPGGVRRVLERCLHKDPLRRLRDIGAARIELEEATSLQASPRLETPALTGSGRANWLLALGLTAVLSALVGSFFPWGAPAVPPQALGVPDFRIQQLTGRPDDDTIHSASLSPDGESLAFATEEGLYLQLVATGEEQRLSLPEGFQVHEVDWLGGGSTLLFSATFNGDTGLYRTSIFGSNPTKISDEARRAAVSPDGSQIAYLASHPSKVLRVMDSDGSSIRTLVELEGTASYWELAWSPEARWLLVGRWTGSLGSEETILEAIEIETGEVRQVLKDARFFQNWRAFLPFAWTADNRLVLALMESAPNERTSNLWQARIDPESASLLGSLQPLSHFVGINLKDLSLSAEGKILSFLMERNQNDVLVGDLTSKRELVNVRPLVRDTHGNDEPVGWGRDNQMLYFQSSRTGTMSIYRRSLQPGPIEFVAARATHRSMHAVAVSPEGTDLLFWEEGELKRVPAQGGPVDVVLETKGEWPRISCDLQGTVCLIGERSADESEYLLFRFDWNSGRGEEVLRFDSDSSFSNWALSPTASHIAFAGNDGRLRFFDLETGEERVVEVEGWRYGEFPAWAADGSGVFIDGGPSTRGDLRKGLLFISMEGEIQSIRQNWTEWITYPRPTSDGKRIAFASQQYAANVWIIKDF